MKNLTELHQEIIQEAERNLRFSIKERRYKISYIALIILTLILTIYFIFFARGLAHDKISLSNIKFYNSALIILLVILAVSIFTGLPTHIINSLKIKRDLKFYARLQTEFERIINERIEFYPIEIGELEKSIESTEANLEEYKEECENEIQEFKKTIEDRRCNLELLQNFEPKGKMST